MKKSTPYIRMLTVAVAGTLLCMSALVSGSVYAAEGAFKKCNPPAGTQKAVTFTNESCPAGYSVDSSYKSKGVNMLAPYTPNIVEVSPNAYRGGQVNSRYQTQGYVPVATAGQVQASPPVIYIPQMYAKSLSQKSYADSYAAANELKYDTGGVTPTKTGATVPVYYDPANAPANATAAQMTDAIQKTLKALNAGSSSEFVYMGVKTQAQTQANFANAIPITWALNLAPNQAGLGGPSIGAELNAKMAMDAGTIQKVMAHEILHVLGLPHTSTQNDLMNPSLSVTSKLTPANYAALNTALQSRKSGTTTVPATSTTTAAVAPRTLTPLASATTPSASAYVPAQQAYVPPVQQPAYRPSIVGHQVAVNAIPAVPQVGAVGSYHTVPVNAIPAVPRVGAVGSFHAVPVNAIQAPRATMVSAARR